VAAVAPICSGAVRIFGAGLAYGRRCTHRRRFPIVLKGASHMKSLFSALVVLGLSLAPSLSKAADSRNVTVVNETGYAIKFLGFNAPDDGLEEWDNELDKTLKNQDSTYVEFDNDDEGCVWNIKVIWANYDEGVLWKNVNLCKFTALRLRYDPGTKTTSFIAE
jgi:hypothetical protein